jgi:RimJ/RimL family protein N-acetyltransferase
MRFIEPVTLRGRHAALEPLESEHAAALRVAAADGELWKLWYTSVPKPENVQAYVDKALQMREDLGAMAFVIRDLRDGELVGSTRYCNVDAANRRLEIGYTWHAARAQRTGINTECKLMLLTHAFETLKCIAVEFRTNFMNHQSREAITRLGAKQDGVLRNHQLLEGGILRDTVVFSIVESEWPAVKRHLQFKLDR